MIAGNAPRWAPSAGDTNSMAEQLREAESAHASRVNIMGEMAASLTHELNQPLTTIINYMGACQRMLDSDDFDRAELRTIMQRVIEQAERAAKIIQNVRQFASNREPTRSKVSINDIVRNVELTTKPEASRNNVHIQLELGSHLPDLAADAIQLERLVQNLLQNAMEALRETPSDRRRVTVRTALADSNTVEIEVQDTGPGIPRDIADRVFESFVSGKTNGLGLGLAISRTIVKSHGGRLTWAPNPGGGTVFTVSLPARAESSR